MEFDSIESLHTLSDILIRELASLHEYDLMEKVLYWSSSSYATSSEFLGEYRLILNNISNLDGLDKKLKLDIRKCIEVINEAFVKANGQR